VKDLNGKRVVKTPPPVASIHLLLLVSGQLAQHWPAVVQSVLDWHLLLTGLSVSSKVVPLAVVHHPVWKLSMDGIFTSLSAKNVSAVG